MLVDDGTASYVLGHSEQELARLERQSEIFGRETRELLRRAGLKPGMHVLDVGCGVGDVSMIAAEMVGPTGSVLGVDRALEALAVARERARRAGYDRLQFADGDLYAFEPTGKFDALVGRFILMHLPDPVGALRHLTRLLKPAATVAFVEMDIDEARAVPELPLLNRCVGWITATYKRVGVEPNMGSKLYATFRAAGLSPDVAGMTRMTGSDDAVVYAFAAQTLTSLLPRIEECGIATAAEVDVGTLAERLRRDAVAGDHCIIMPRLVGAWAKTATG